MKTLVLFLLLIFSTFSYSASFVKGKGVFLSKDKDTLAFIKGQLLHEAFMDIINKEMTSMGLNPHKFWDKFNEKLDKKNLIISDSLKLKMKITDESGDIQLREFETRLRVQKLKTKRKFGKLESIIQSYTIRKNTRSAKNPKLRSIYIEAKTNRQLLSKIYYKHVKGKKHSDFGTLFLNIDYDLKGLTFSEMGIENEKDFTSVINKNWLEWFDVNKPEIIASVEVLNEENRLKLHELNKQTYETLIAEIPDIFVNSLLFDINIKITKVSFDKKTNEYSVKYSGSAYLKDLQSNTIVKTITLSNIIKSYRVEEEVRLANVIANHVYRMVNGYFPTINTAIKNLSPISNFQRVALFEFPNMNKVGSFVELMKNQGVKFSLKLRMVSMNKERVDYIAFYDGEVGDLKALLLSLKSAKTDLSFELIDTDNLLGIKFNKEVVPLKGVKPTGGSALTL